MWIATAVFLSFTWGFGIGAIVHDEDVVKIKVVKKASDLK